jgi:hypothetical protein
VQHERVRAGGSRALMSLGTAAASVRSSRTELEMGEN